MNYRHAYHAGNFADVVKHVALIAILQHLKKKETAFTVIDTHAGRGAYDLAGVEAAKTAECENGIGLLRDLGGDMPEALSTYLALTKNSAYPGSPLIAAQLLRPQDRLVAIEKHPEEFAALQDILAPCRNVSVENSDGHIRLPKLLPPSSRRGLVLIDPPFEAEDEFQTLAQTIATALRKFATGIFLVWYPIKSHPAVDGFIGETMASGVVSAMSIEAGIVAPEGKLDRAGLLIINPPYGLQAAMQDSANLIAPLMRCEIKTDWLASAD